MQHTCLDTDVSTGMQMACSVDVNGKNEEAVLFAPVLGCLLLRGAFVYDL